MIFFDVETTNLDYGDAGNPDNRIVCIAWANDDLPVRHYYGDILDAREFWQDLSRADAACAFNCKFEAKWLWRLGFDVDNIKWHDPMLAEKVLLGNIQLPMNLGAVCERYGYDTKDPMIDTLMKNGVCPSDMPEKRLIARCVRDVRTTRSVMRTQMRELHRREQLHLYRNRCEFAIVLSHIEANGMHLNPTRVRQEYEKYSQNIGILQTELDKITGGINLRSPDQVAKFLYQKLKFPERRGPNRKPLRNKPSKQFPDGRPKTDKVTMTWLEGQATTDEQRRFLSKRQEYSKANAALTKNLEFFKGVVDEKNGWFRAQFNQTVAATHRLTSSGVPIQFEQFPKPKSVQFQNMPREFKSCFDAPEGYVIAEIDAMQLEFRVAAFLGQDKQAMADIADSDFDAHCRTASVMQGIEYHAFLTRYRAGDKAYSAMRTAAKPDTFKPLYGGTKGTPEQEKYYKAFAQRYYGVANEQENWLATVMADGCLKTAWGMKFTWDVYTNSKGVAMNKKTFKPVGPQVFNYPVQNLATAEIVPIAITALYKATKAAKLDVKFVNTIHDSVIVYIRDDEETLEAFAALAKEAFTTAVYEHLRILYGIEFNVPLGMEMVVGSLWGQGTEMIYDDVHNWNEDIA